MKKVIAISLLSLSLGACGTRTVVVEKVSPTIPQTEAPPITEAYGVDNYIANVVARYPNLLNNLGRQWLINYANTTCDSIDSGMTLSDLADMSVSNNVDASMVGFLTGEAIRNFCPRNQWFIDAAANA